MAPPLNTSAATAILIDRPFEYTNTQRVDDAGVTYTVWYRYDPRPGEILMGFFAFGDLTTYFPVVEVYRGLDPANIVTNWMGAPTNRPLQFAPEQRYIYWFRIRPHAGNPTPANLSVSMIQASQAGNFPPGSLYVNDDTDGLPAIILDQHTGDMLGIIPATYAEGIPSTDGGQTLRSVAGEAGDILPNGFMAWENRYGNSQNNPEVLVTGPQGQFVGSVRYDTFLNIRANRHVGKFAVTSAANNPTGLDVINTEGVVEETIPITGLTAAIQAMATSPDLSTMFYSSNSDGRLKSYNLLTGTDNGTLYNSGTSLGVVSDIVQLADRSIAFIVAEFNFTPPAGDVPSITVYLVTEGGVLLHQYALGAGVHVSFQHLAYGPTDDTFWAWTHDSDGFTSDFTLMNTDGTIERTFSVPEFEVGSYLGPMSANPPRFGISTSCTFAPLGRQVIPPIRPTDVCCCETTPTGPPIGGGGPGGTGPGETGGNHGGHGWTTTGCNLGVSGTVPQHADPADGEELDGKATIEMWAEVEHAGQTYRWAVMTLPHLASYHGGRKEGRLTQVGSVTHALSDNNGNFEGFSLSLSVSDHDRAIRTLLGDTATSRFLLDEIRLYLVSREGRIAGTAPRVIARAEISQYPSSAPLMVRLEGIDPLFGDFGQFRPDRKMPSWTVPSGVFTEAPPDSQRFAWTIVYGEVSDEGATDPATGHLSEKGLVPLRYLGTKVETFEGGDPPPVTVDTSQSPVPRSNCYSETQTGTIRTVPYYYVSPMRNGRIGPTGILLGGHSPEVAHADRIAWDAIGGADSYIVWQFSNPEWHPFDNPGVDSTVYYQTHNGVSPSVLSDWDFDVLFTGAYGSDESILWNPVINGIAGQPPTISRDYYLVAGHAVAHITSVFGSDLGANDPDGHVPRRVKLNPDGTPGLMVPGYSSWPFGTTYLDYTDTDGRTYRGTYVILPTGHPISEDHKAGRVTLSANVCGIEDVGDGTGTMISDFFAAYQHFLENFVLNDYSSGNWVTGGTHPQREDGTAMVRSSSFTAAQQLSAARVGGYGYQVGWCMAEQMSLRDAIQFWNDSGDCRLGQNSHGQMVVAMLDTTADTSGWKHFTHVEDMFNDSAVEIWTEGAELENEVKGQYDWDADAGQYRSPKLTVSSPAAISAYHGHRRTGKMVGLRALRNHAHAVDVLQRRLARLAYGPRYVRFTTHAGGMDVDIGDGLLLTTIEGDGSLGYVRRPMLVLRQEFDVNTFLVTLTCLDLDGILSDPFVLGSEGTTANVLGSEALGTAMVLV